MLPKSVDIKLTIVIVIYKHLFHDTYNTSRYTTYI